MTAIARNTHSPTVPPVSRSAALELAQDQLDTAITSAGSPTEWSNRFNLAIEQLIRAMLEHQQDAEGPDGSLADMAQRAPQLINRIRLQQIEHSVMLSEAARTQATIREQIGQSTVNIRLLRDRGAYLYDRVRSHIAQANDLLFEAYYSDIGGES